MVNKNFQNTPKGHGQGLGAEFLNFRSWQVPSHECQSTQKTGVVRVQGRIFNFKNPLSEFGTGVNVNASNQTNVKDCERRVS